jgi:parallel beta-helix repeat protein
VVIRAGGTAAIEDCQVFENSGDGIGLEGNVRATIRRCTITNNKDSGIRADGGAGGIIEDCDLRGNGRAWNVPWLSGLKRTNNRER